MARKRKASGEPDADDRPGAKRGRKRGKTHRVRSHTRVTRSGKRTRVKAHRRRHPKR